MPESNRNIDYWLEQIISLADRVAAHVAGMSVHEFVDDAKTVDAASWCIACIGEACGKILEIDRNFGKGVGLELSAAYAARNRYVHGYYDLDLEQVWDTVNLSVPALAEIARTMLRRDGA